MMISLYENIIYLLFMRYLLSRVINILRSRVFQDYLKVLLWRCTLRPQLLLCVSNLLKLFPHFFAFLWDCHCGNWISFQGYFLKENNLCKFTDIIGSHSFTHYCSEIWQLLQYIQCNGLAVSCNSFKHYAVPRWCVFKTQVQALQTSLPRRRVPSLPTWPQVSPGWHKVREAGKGLPW